MKNAGIAGGLVAIGLGLATIGLSNFSRNANAVPAVALPAGPEDPQIVWYGVVTTNDNNSSHESQKLYRAWSDGTIEAKHITNGPIWDNCGDTSPCAGSWFLVSSPTEGLNAAADINFDGDVDGADLGLVLGYWGDAPRSPIPASDCPLGLMQ